jgi:hypothetical protein
MKTHKIILRELPKISLNKWYAGAHWSARTKIKNEYILLVGAQTKQRFTKLCDVEYEFNFEKKPLDASNCVAMVKLIEDILFADDSGKVVRSIKISSKKCIQEFVVIYVTELQ